MATQLEEFKSRQRAIWDAGDFGTLSEHIADVGELVVGHAGSSPGCARSMSRVAQAMPPSRRRALVRG